MMGTSVGYMGPKTPQWSSMKGTVSRAAGEGRLTSSKIGEILKDFAPTIRNSIREGRSGRSGGFGSAGTARVAGATLGSFLSNIAQNGIQDTLAKSGLKDFTGKTIAEISSDLVEHLIGNASTIDDVAAREAMADTIDGLLAEAKTPEDVKQILEEAASSDRLEEILMRFFSCYLLRLFEGVFFERLSKIVGNDEAHASIDSISEYIMSRLTDVKYERDLSTVDWTSPKGNKMITSILEDTLEVFSK